MIITLNHCIIQKHTLVKSRKTHLQDLYKNLFLFSQLMFAYYFNTSTVIKIITLGFVVVIVIPNIVRIFQSKRSIAEVILIGYHESSFIKQLGRISYKLEEEKCHEVLSVINYVQPDAILINTNEVATIRKTLLANPGKPVLILPGGARKLVLSDIFPNPRKYYTKTSKIIRIYCPNRGLYRNIKQILHHEQLRSTLQYRNADVIVDLTCISNIDIVKIIKHSIYLKKVAMKTKKPLLLITPIHSIIPENAAVYRAYEHICSEYWDTKILRIPNLVDLSMKYPNIATQTLWIDTVSLARYISIALTTNLHINEFPEGDYMSSGQIKMILEQVDS